MPSGWLLDITEGRDGRSVVLWLKEEGGGVRPRVEPWLPPFLVDGPTPLLRSIVRELSDSSVIERVDWRSGRPSLFDTRPRRYLRVTPRHYRERRRLASALDARGDFTRLSLYDVDLTAPHLYHLGHGLYPFAPVVWDSSEVRATEPPETVDYRPPPLVLSTLSVHLRGRRRGGITEPNDTIDAVEVGPVKLEGEERDLLPAVAEEVRRQDPDVIVTHGGDSFDMPWLYRRVEAVGLTERDFFLGRAPGSFRPQRSSFSYESYGTIRHRDATFTLDGRFHVDTDDSFLYPDAAVDGLIEAARLSRLSLQTVVRQSPGTCFTAMEMAHALAQGAHVPWKKNRPEHFKSAATLLAADRGGVIFLPPVGVHDHVDEFDFASLYPHIMVRKNLSIETLDCGCCPRSPIVAPGLGYHSCTRRRGLIPRTLEPLLTRRLAYKAALKQGGLAPREKERLTRRVKMLKWILVTAFGYQGYRNARFGRIECHEAINAYARDLLASLIGFAEESGYRLIHGIVDSLWVTPRDPARPPDPERFAQAVTERFDLPLAYEGRYRWILFLPATTHGLGVPNRYYGLYDSGEFKLRGIGLRRHDTPNAIRRFEQEVLARFARAGSAEEVRAALPMVLARADRFAQEIADGAWPAEELVVTHRVLKAPEEFVTFTDTVAALRQLSDRGVRKEAGESVGYVIRDRRSRSWRDRVRPDACRDRPEPYDPGAYLELLARSAETLLAPLGVTRTMLQKRWGVTAPPRNRYRSVESPAQQLLAEGERIIGPGSLRTP
jgi:DNA polymerase elongation subunit (family B)